MTFEHDWRLAALATGVCLLSGLAAINLLGRAQTPGEVKILRLIAAGLAIAFGVGAFSLDPSSLFVAIAAVAVAAFGVMMTAAFYDRRLAEREAEFDVQCAAMAREAQDQLRDRNALLDTALNNMSQALCMFDADKRPQGLQSAIRRCLRSAA